MATVIKHMHAWLWKFHNIIKHADARHQLRCKFPEPLWIKAREQRILHSQNKIAHKCKQTSFPARSTPILIIAVECNHICPLSWWQKHKANIKLSNTCNLKIRSSCGQSGRWVGKRHAMKRRRRKWSASYLLASKSSTTVLESYFVIPMSKWQTPGSTLVVLLPSSVGKNQAPITAIIMITSLFHCTHLQNTNLSKYHH